MKVADPWAQPAAERFFTPATIVTIVRTIAAVVLCSAACYREDVRFLVASLAVYWIGDSLDGWVARIAQSARRVLEPYSTSSVID